MVGHGGVNGRVVNTRNRHPKVVTTDGVLTAVVGRGAVIGRLRFRLTHL
ncbi:hypothetical protein EN05_019950 [Vibrio parahaemolyticus]|nr:hypothetical protein EN05_019950 [Vibrio parahaemolyticus]